MPLTDHANAFEVSIPANWTWFFLRQRQLILCFQDPTHICTKLRNHLLSSKATLGIGKQRISLDILSKLIANTNKLIHGLVKSDVYPRDRQNFASCEKISSDDVQLALEVIPDSQAMRLYLKLIRSIITAYIDKATSINNRLYHAWFSVFLCRMWWAWLLVKAKYDFDETFVCYSNNNASSQGQTKSIRQFFITNILFQSIEINAHQLTYLTLLVVEEKLPIEALQIFLFNSQTCESTFRSTRAMSGAFSSIVNFSVMQFLNRAQKLSILHAIKSESEVNSSVVNSASLVFPKYRKESSKLTSSATVSTTCLLTKNDIQRIVSSAFHDVFELLSTLDVDNALKENNIHTLKNLSSFILNEMNAMTNTIDDSTPEDTESDSESDAIFDYHDSINEEGNETDNDYDSTIYELNDVTGDIFPG
ncbi:unnamed protein product, partial [Rotaria sp. Silwood1]